MSWLIMAQMMILLLLDLAPANRFEHVGTSLVNALLLRLSALLPASLPAVALAAALPVALLCWTATRLFNGLELPPPTAAPRHWCGNPQCVSGGRHARSRTRP